MRGEKKKEYDLNTKVGSNCKQFYTAVHDKLGLVVGQPMGSSTCLNAANVFGPSNPNPSKEMPFNSVADQACFSKAPQTCLLGRSKEHIF